MKEIILQLDDNEIELLERMSWFNDMPGEWQSDEMESLGLKIRNSIEELD